MGIHQLLPISGAAVFSPVKHIYTSGSSATETIPSGGATNMEIQVWGGGAGGGPNDGGASGFAGGGGGGGAYSRATFTVSGHSSQTLTYTVGASCPAGSNGNTSSCSSGSFVISVINCTGGGVGQPGTSGGPGSGGTGGAPTNANTGAVNTSGHVGSAGVSATGGAGGAGITGNVSGDGSPYGAGGAGGSYPSGGYLGGNNGAVVFYYT